MAKLTGRDTTDEVAEDRAKGPRRNAGIARGPVVLDGGNMGRQCRYSRADRLVDSLCAEERLVRTTWERSIRLLRMRHASRSQSMLSRLIGFIGKP